MALPTTYDLLIHKYRGAIPFDFIKILIKHESGFNPQSDMGLKRLKTTGKYGPGDAKGLMQVVQSVREDFNEKFMTAYTPQDLFDPEISIKLGCFTLNNIVKGYARNHPNTLAPDWNDARWVELFLFGWNAGYSEKGGVGRVVSALEKADIPKDKITIDNVQASAERVGAAKYLYEIDKVKWCKGVARNFFLEVARQKDSQRKNVT